MKLEEVLPAMRAGRVAVTPCGTRYIFSYGNYRWQGSDGNWVPATALLLDGWTLEPEPKVEWPKGSIQWACEKAGDRGSVSRRGQGWYVAAGDIGSAHIDCISFFALDWEVVP